MVARAYMLSLLARQHLALKERFVERYPCAWLIWEPGFWNVPGTAMNDPSQTRLPTRRVDRPSSGDALCFELQGAPGSTFIRIGRAPEANEVVINDATVSREHATLAHDAKGLWSVSALGREVQIAGRPAAPGKPSPIVNGESLSLGDVKLTFHDRRGILTRLGVEADRMATAKAR